jgi:hypothetical protein
MAEDVREQLAAAAHAARERPGTEVYAYSEADRAHLVAEAARMRERAAELERRAAGG